MNKPLVPASRMSDALKKRDSLGQGGGYIKKAGVYVFALGSVSAFTSKKDGLDGIAIEWIDPTDEYGPLKENLVIQQPEGDQLPWVDGHLRDLTLRMKSLNIKETSQIETMDDLLRLFRPKVGTKVQLGVGIKERIWEKDGVSKLRIDADVRRSYAMNETANFDTVYWTSVLSAEDAAKLSPAGAQSVTNTSAAQQLPDEPTGSKEAVADARNEFADLSDLSDLSGLSDPVPSKATETPATKSAIDDLPDLTGALDDLPL